MYKYADWAKEELCKMEKELLMTSAQVRKERKDSDEKGLDDAQLDMLKDCAEGLCKIYHVRSMMAEATAKGHMMHHAASMPQA